MTSAEVSPNGQNQEQGQQQAEEVEVPPPKPAAQCAPLVLVTALATV